MILEKNNNGKFKFLQDLSFREEPNQQTAEKYLCSLYGMKGISDVNEVGADDRINTSEQGEFLQSIV